MKRRREEKESKGRKKRGRRHAADTAYRIPLLPELWPLVAANWPVKEQLLVFARVCKQFHAATVPIRRGHVDLSILQWQELGHKDKAAQVFADHSITSLEFLPWGWLPASMHQWLATKQTRLVSLVGDSLGPPSVPLMMVMSRLVSLRLIVYGMNSWSTQPSEGLCLLLPAPAPQLKHLTTVGTIHPNRQAQLVVDAPELETLHILRACPTYTDVVHHTLSGLRSLRHLTITCTITDDLQLSAPVLEMITNGLPSLRVVATCTGGVSSWCELRDELFSPFKTTLRELDWTFVGHWRARKSLGDTDVRFALHDLDKDDRNI